MSGFFFHVWHVLEEDFENKYLLYACVSHRVMTPWQCQKCIVLLCKFSCRGELVRVALVEKTASLSGRMMCYYQIEII